MYCVECGKEFSDKLILCPDCGGDLLRVKRNNSDYPYVIEKVLSKDRLNNFKKMFFQYHKVSNEEEFFKKYKVKSLDSFCDKYNADAKDAGDDNIYDVLFVFHNMFKNWSNYIEVVSTLTNGKVDDKDIWCLAMFVEDKLEELPLTKEYIYDVDKKLKGRTVLSTVLSIVVDAIPDLLKKLSIQEMRYFIFCMVLRDFIKIDTLKVKGVSGVFAFSSVDAVKFLYEKYAHEFLCEENILPLYDNTKPFGYSKENPVEVCNVAMSYSYMKVLRSDKGYVTVKRNGSSRGIFGEILDVYNITVNFEDSDKKEKYVIYVNPYSIHNSQKAPDGFKLR